jgi:serine/threonine-protein kinase
MTVAPDLSLGGRYRLVELIATGGMGQVWRARDDVLGRVVAIKILKPELAEDATFRQRFRDEGRHSAPLSHPGIATVFDYGESDGYAYLVMEHVDGRPLSKVLEQAGRLPVQQALDVVGQAALALDAAHQAGVVHRDVKPGNLLLRADGVVKVTDFGVARAVHTAPLTQTGTVFGTAQYLSPEQVSGQPVTAASDIYSLGLVAYECVSGQRPFGGDNAVETALARLRGAAPGLPDTVPEPTRALIARAMAADPVDRFPTAADMGRTALALAAQPHADPPTKPLTTPIPLDTRIDPEQRRTRRWFIAIGSLVVIIGFFALRACAQAATGLVPKVVGQTQAVAVSALRHAGFAVTVRTRYDPAAGKGVVIAEAPAGGSRIDKGTTVRVTVSAGPRLVTVDPAAYIGQPLPAVTAALQRLGLRVGPPVTAPHTPGPPSPPGTVLSVTPSGQVPVGSTVTVTVSGPGGHKDHGDNGD